MYRGAINTDWGGGGGGGGLFVGAVQRMNIHLQDYLPKGTALRWEYLA